MSPRQSPVLECSKTLTMRTYDVAPRSSQCFALAFSGFDASQGAIAWQVEGKQEAMVLG